ncbi:hypothetical protein BGZ83_008483 [Gryganskiella cystojenkinii]|nr:hypothetical protein BGZ83_008483 [Gryganskiella cystojenkinii]
MLASTSPTNNNTNIPSTTTTAITTEIPVLISGGGPTGLFAGLLLRKMNIPVRIIERDFEISPLSKALGIHSRSQEILQVTDASLIQEFLRQSQPGGSWRMYYDGKLASEILPVLSNETYYPKIMLLPQNKTVQILSDAFEKAGGEMSRGWELMDTRVIEDGGETSWVETTIRRSTQGTNKRSGEATNNVLGTVELAAEDPEKQYEYETVKSQYLIAADGGRSVVRHKINMPFPGRTRDFNMILFDGLLDTAISTDHFNMINGNNNKTVVMFPLGEQSRVRIMFDNGIATAEEFAEQHKTRPLTTEGFQQLLDEAVKPLAMKITKVNWLTYYRVNERRAQEYSYKDRIFLAGDAAHVHSPAGGQGLNTGVQDAYNLAWKIAMVLNGTAPSTLLDSYNEERPAIGDQIIQFSSRNLEGMLEQDFLQRIIKRVAVALLPTMNALLPNGSPAMSMLGLRYHENSLNKTHPNQSSSPTAPGAIGRRAADSALVPFLLPSTAADSGHNSSSSSSSNTSVSSNCIDDSLTATFSKSVTNNDATSSTATTTVRLHEVMAHPGVFQILVFTGKQWKYQPEAVAKLFKRLDNYLSKWRSTWPSSDILRPHQFMVHILTTVKPSQVVSQSSTAAVQLLAKRTVDGEGKVYRDLTKVLHSRYGVDPAVKKSPEESGAIVVVRPDSHIGFRVQGAGATAWEDVDEYFESILLIKK